MLNKNYLVMLMHIATACSSIYAQTPANIMLTKKAVAHYYESGIIDQEITNVLDEAWNQLKDLTPTSQSVVIIDIDETALSNYHYYKLMDLNKGSESAFTYWKSLGHCYAIKPMVSFYQKLIDKGFKIIFISGRSIEIYDQTMINLQKTGYHTFERIILRTEEDTKVPFNVYKKQKRYDLVDEGYDIVACIGDQVSDLEGEHTGVKIKIPNYILYE